MQCGMGVQHCKPEYRPKELADIVNHLLVLVWSCHETCIDYDSVLATQLIAGVKADLQESHCTHPVAAYGTGAITCMHLLPGPVMRCINGQG